MQGLDENGRPYKCGPNWVPNWIYDEPLFKECCKTHDIAWSEGKSKCCSDATLLQCCWKRADTQTGWWRVRAKLQAVVMYSILLLNPVSYILYFVSRCKRFINHD